MYRTCSSKEKQNAYTHINTVKYNKHKKESKEKKQKTRLPLPFTFYWPLTLKLCRLAQRVREAESGVIS